MPCGLKFHAHKIVREREAFRRVQLLGRGQAKQEYRHHENY